MEKQKNNLFLFFSFLFAQLKSAIKQDHPDVECVMNDNISPRSGAFEIVAVKQNKLLHSKLATAKFPSAAEAVELVAKFKKDASQFPDAPVVDRTQQASSCSIQ
jgi:selT/selW/selH-like putative selenoprotein